MQQMERETIDQFVCHLRHKAISCEFPSVDEAIPNQIIEKSIDPKLRRKFLEKSSEATLTVLQETARVHEAVNTQMQSMERPEQVNKGDKRKETWKTKEMLPVWWNWSSCTGQELSSTRQDIINVVKVVTLRLAARQSQPRNLVKDTVQKCMCMIPMASRS